LSNERAIFLKLIREIHSVHETFFGLGSTEGRDLRVLLADIMRFAYEKSLSEDSQP